MKIGVIYPTTEAGGDPDVIRAFVTGAEAAGLDYLQHFDHVLKASHADREPPLQGLFNETHSFDDPFVFYAYVAGITQKLEFATGVLILPQRQTAVLAQQVANLDLLSKQRFRLGVGSGWNYVEYIGLGQDFSTRGRRMDEQIGLLRKLWADPIVEFEGEFDRIDRACINPRPRRLVPIWVGGHAEPAYRRGAALGDGFIFAGRGPMALAELERVRHHLREAGRSEDPFGRELMAHGESRQEIVDSLKAWRDAGGTHACIATMNKGFGVDTDAHLDYLAEVRRLLG